jgi:hypothetical protein
MDPAMDPAMEVEEEELWELEDVNDEEEEQEVWVEEVIEDHWQDDCIETMINTYFYERGIFSECLVCSENVVANLGVKREHMLEEHEEYLKQYCKEANDEWMKERGYKGNKWNNPVEEIGMLKEGDDESERRRSRGL